MRKPFSHIRPMHTGGRSSTSNPTAGSNGFSCAAKGAHDQDNDNSSAEGEQPFVHPEWAARSQGHAPHVRNAAARRNDTTRAAPCSDSTSTASAGGVTDTNRITLRCMYTTQKTKKRKVWSDGAVKCCPRRQRVVLHGWSEVLGVTDKQLGEIYLSVPEYQAFVSNQEPELEMELYIVSLDGVIQNEPFSSRDSSNKQSANKEATAPGAFSGRKRKLIKPFKPPTRRAPPTAPPADPWAQAGRDDRFGSAGNVPWEERTPQVRPAATLKNSRTNYTGFGHVESLWDDDEQEDVDRDLEGRQAQTTAWGVQPKGCGNTGHDQGGYEATSMRGTERGMMSGVGRDSHTRANAGAMHLSAAAGDMNAAERGDGNMWRGRGGHDTADGDGPGSAGGLFHRAANVTWPNPSGMHDSTVGFGRNGQSSSSHDSGHDGPQDHGRGSSFGSVHDAHDWLCEGRADRSTRGDRRSTGAERSETDHQQAYHREKENELGRPIHGPEEEHRRLSHDAISVQEGCRDGELHGGVVEGQARSTQDILSLFGDFGDVPRAEPITSRAPLHDEEQKEWPSALSESRFPQDNDDLERDVSGPNEPHSSATSLPATTGSGLVPGAKGGGAEMRRAQKVAREAQRASTLPEANSDSSNGRTHTVGRPWCCGVCGVRGSPSARSCRVCGADRGRGSGDDGEGQGEGRSSLRDVVDDANYLRCRSESSRVHRGDAGSQDENTDHCRDGTLSTTASQYGGQTQPKDGDKDYNEGIHTRPRSQRSSTPAVGPGAEFDFNGYLNASVWEGHESGHPADGMIGDDHTDALPRPNVDNVGIVSSAAPSVGDMIGSFDQLRGARMQIDVGSSDSDDGS